MQQIIETDKIEFTEEMDWEGIKKDFNNTLVNEQFNLRGYDFDFILLPYYLFEMAHNAFRDSDKQNRFLYVISKEVLLSSPSKENIMIYKSNVFDYMNKQSNLSIGDYNIIDMLAMMLQKYVFDFTGYRFGRSSIGSVCDFVTAKLSEYMIKNKIKKVILYDKSNPDDIKVKTIFIIPTVTIE